MFTKAEIKTQLKTLNIPYKKPIIVHTSMKLVGDIEGGADTLLEALIDERAEKEGLLCIPTHTWDELFLDLKNPRTCLGLLPTLSLKYPLGIRSMHPTHSLTVFGDKNRVTQFLENEKNVNTPTSPDGCYGNLIKEEGYVLLVGVDQRKNTIIHCIEEMLCIKNRLTKEKIETKIILENGDIEKRYLHWFDETVSEDVSLNFEKFEPAFRKYNCITDGYIGNAKVQLCSIKKMFDVLAMIYKNAGDKELMADDLPLDENLYI